MSDLRTLEAPSLHPGGESYKKIELAKWLSDWHLVAFLGTTGLFSPVSPIVNDTENLHQLLCDD